MPRPLRIQDAGYVHHVICRGNDRQIIFKSDSDFLAYIDLVEKSRKLYPIHIYNYCLMDNHLHLLVEPKEEKSLSKFMEDVSKAYAKYFNEKYDHVGHVFQGRFKSFLVQEERYFFVCSRYIDLNPVNALMVTNPIDYKWSGYRLLAAGEESALRLDQHELYINLESNTQERQIAYKALVHNYQGEELNLLEKRAGVLGDTIFKDKLKNLLNLNRNEDGT